MAILSESQLRQLIDEVLTRHGLRQDEVPIVSDVILDAEICGRTSHGLARLPRILDTWKKAKRGEIKVVLENSYSALVDGADNLGPVVAKFAMNLCIEKARRGGLGLVGVRNPDPFLLAGYYTRMALKEHMVGIAMANSRARIAPWQGIDPVLGVNPVSIAIPSANQPIVLDMALSRITISDINYAKKLGALIPSNQAIDKDGRPTKDPSEALDGALWPIDTYKGYGLALIVEILAGPLVSAKAGKTVPGARGYLFAAIDPGIFGDIEIFEQNAAKLIEEIKSSRKRGRAREILVPGELRERFRRKAVTKGVSIDEGLLAEIRNLLG